MTDDPGLWQRLPSLRWWLMSLALIAIGAGLIILGRTEDIDSATGTGILVLIVGVVGGLWYGEKTATELTRIPTRARRRRREKRGER